MGPGLGGGVVVESHFGKVHLNLSFTGASLMEDPCKIRLINEREIVRQLLRGMSFRVFSVNFCEGFITKFGDEFSKSPN